MLENTTKRTLGVRTSLNLDKTHRVRSWKFPPFTELTRDAKRAGPLLCSLSMGWDRWFLPLPRGARTLSAEQHWNSFHFIRGNGHGMGGGVPGHLRHAGDTCVLDRLLEQARKITPSSCNMTQWPAPSTRENAWILGTLMTRARKGGHKCQIFTSSPPLGLCPSPGGGQVKPAAQDGLCILDKNWKNMDKAQKPRLQICTHDPSSQGSSELGNPTGF